VSRTEHSKDYKDLLLDMSYGLLSGLLYLSYALAFFFLTPLQYAYARKGKKAGIRASATSLIIIAAGMIFGMGDFSSLRPEFVAISLVPPALCMIACWYINSGIGRPSQGQKTVIVSALLSVIVWPFLNKMLSDASFTAGLEAMVQESLASVSGQQIDATVIRPTLESAMRIVRSAYAPAILGFVAANWGLGNSLATAKAYRTGAIDAAAVQKKGAGAVYVPYSLLWPTLLAWTALLIVNALHKEGTVAWITWNVALFLAALYAAQGIGILDFFFKRLKFGGLLRLLMPLLVVACFVNQTVATIVLIALPLLGITEVWFPYRNFKGVRL